MLAHRVLSAVFSISGVGVICFVLQAREQVVCDKADQRGRLHFSFFDKWKRPAIIAKKIRQSKLFNQ